MCASGNASSPFSPPSATPGNRQPDPSASCACIPPPVGTCPRLRPRKMHGSRCSSLPQPLGENLATLYNPSPPVVCRSVTPPLRCVSCPDMLSVRTPSRNSNQRSQRPKDTHLGMLVKCWYTLTCCHKTRQHLTTVWYIKHSTGVSPALRSPCQLVASCFDTGAQLHQSTRRALVDARRTHPGKLARLVASDFWEVPQCLRPRFLCKAAIPSLS